MTTKTQTSKSNALGDPAESLQTFDLTDLQQYTREKTYATTASKDFHLFYVGRDDVHDVLKHVLSRVSISLYLNMFGFDDEELNDILMAKAKEPARDDDDRVGRPLVPRPRGAGHPAHPHRVRP